MFDQLNYEDQKGKSREDWALAMCRKTTNSSDLFRVWAAWMCPAEISFSISKDEFGAPILDEKGYIVKKKSWKMTQYMITQYMAIPKRLTVPSAKQRFVEFCRKNNLTPSPWSIHPFKL